MGQHRRRRALRERRMHGHQPRRGQVFGGQALLACLHSPHLVLLVVLVRRLLRLEVHVAVRVVQWRQRDVVRPQLVPGAARIGREVHVRGRIEASDRGRKFNTAQQANAPS